MREETFSDWYAFAVEQDRKHRDDERRRAGCTCALNAILASYNVTVWLGLVLTAALPGAEPFMIAGIIAFATVTVFQAQKAQRIADPRPR